MKKLIVLVAVSLVALGVPAVAASARPAPDIVCGTTVTSNPTLRHDLDCGATSGLGVLGSSPTAPDPSTSKAWLATFTTASSTTR